MIPMKAKRIDNGYAIFVDNMVVPLGTLIFFSDERRDPPIFESDYDQELASVITDHFLHQSYRTMQEILAVVRRSYEALSEDRRLEQAAEIHAENAWLRRAESDQEAFDEMVWQDMAGFT